MDSIVALILPQLPTLEEIVMWGGYVGLFAIIFAETGLLVGFFLPGDSLLVTAGLFAARGELDIVLLNLLLIIAAITGDATGYFIGAKAGQALYNRPQTRFFRKDYLLKTKEFYEKYGGIGWVTSMTLVGYYLGRSIPGIEKNIEYVIGIVIILSILPMIIKYLQHRSKKRAEARVPANGKRNVSET